jgi:ferredoxin
MISFIVPTKKISRHPNVPSSSWRILLGRTLCSSSSAEDSSELHIPNDSYKNDSAEMAKTSLPTSIISEDDSSTLISTTTTTSATTPTTTSTTATTTSTVLQVSYENQFCHIPIIPKETILSALEKHSDKLRLLGLPELPSECRRGNCMTCAGKLVSRHPWQKEEEEEEEEEEQQQQDKSKRRRNKSFIGIFRLFGKWIIPSYIPMVRIIWIYLDM